MAFFFTLYIPFINCDLVTMVFILPSVDTIEMYLQLSVMDFYVGNKDVNN